MKEEFIVIENENNIYRVKIMEIVSIIINDGILTFVLEDGRKLLKTMTLKSGMEILPCFTRIYRNIAVNTNRVKEINKKTRIVLLDNDVSYKVSCRYVSKILLEDRKVRLRF